MNLRLLMGLNTRLVRAVRSCQNLAAFLS